MMTIHYQKRKNQELFKQFEEPISLFLSKPQNYIPIYTRFFGLNETNYNGINFNNKWFLSRVEERIEEGNDNLFYCKVKNTDTNKVVSKEVFFKMAPLLDPYKYMIGKYDMTNPDLFTLPRLQSSLETCNPKFLDPNNAAYVDGLFAFLSSLLQNTHKFVHSVAYYGSYLALKKEFKLNIYDDIDYLTSSDFFNKNKDTLFKVDNYDHLFQLSLNPKLKPLHIGDNVSLKSLGSLDEDMFENIFDDQEPICDNHGIDDLVDLTHANLFSNQQMTLRSTSTCSSRSSYTNDDDLDLDLEDNECNACFQQEEDDGNQLSELKQSIDIKKGPQGEDGDDVQEGEGGGERDDAQEGQEREEGDEGEGEYEEDEEDEEEEIFATIPTFPVQVIAMESCEDTFDNLILDNELSNEEWLSALMQKVMILITYQKAFQFTHNDLHTNNVMYNSTDKKFLYYCYNKKYYKVPTFGRIFKIIDFGRSIYKFDGKVFCSDSFQTGGDAATQYNTEPYLDERKPRLEPNPSFDLCRLACSMFDYVVEDFEELKDTTKLAGTAKRIIIEWCTNDKGINMLYKNNGVERYPEFKLYKMIARCVHAHTPQAQLERPEFDAFSRFSGSVKNLEEVVNIDLIPSYI
jgi:hypothetical protein